MSLVDALGLLIPLSFFGLLALEAVLPKRMAMPERRGWRFVGLGFFVLMGIIQGHGPLAMRERRGRAFVALVFFVLMGIIQGTGPLLVPASIAERYRLLDLSWLG